MIKNLFKVAVRSLLKHKGYSLINIVGLATGMACCVVLSLWVVDELSYDKHQANIANLYRVVEQEELTSSSTIRYAVLPGPVGPALKAQYPEIANTARYATTRGKVVSIGDTAFNESDIVFADPSIFALFTLPFIVGDSATALADPHSIVLTEKMSRKYFGDQNPVGRTMTIDNKQDHIVTGVIKDLPSNTHLKFDCLIPLEAMRWDGRDLESWGAYAYSTYVLLRDGVSADVVNGKISNLIMENDPEAIATIYLQPVSRIHLYSQNIGGIGGDGDIRYVYIFSVIALFVLIIACINFMNLTTARSSGRAREVGLRKVVGATRMALVQQFFGESVLMSFIALLAAIPIVELFLPTFNQLSGKELSLGYGNNWILWGGLVAVALVTGLLAGSYPALLLSSFQPTRVLKGSVAGGARSKIFRRVLVVTQFAFTILLVIGSIVVYKQIGFMRSAELGYNHDYVIAARLSGQNPSTYETIRNRLLQNSGILGVTAVSTPPTRGNRSTLIDQWEGRTSEDVIQMYVLQGDKYFLETFGIDVMDGESFVNLAEDTTVYQYIINKRAVELMGMESPIGKSMRDGARIVGVMEDFHFNSMHRPIEALIYIENPDAAEYVCARLSPQNVDGAISYFESVWHEVVPGYPFEYEFLDEQLDRLYRADRRIGKVVSYFTGLTLIISCLGLLGLAAFMAEQRTKEVGIRKVLGASEIGIIGLLSQEFVVLVGIAAVIACPVGWYIMNRWLQNYAYRIDIGIDTFLMATGGALVISLATVIFQAIRAARANPVESLKYE